jgi:glutathione S-transferase
MNLIICLSTIAAAFAAPKDDDDRVVVRYFDSRGRAESSRLLLSALEIKYDEVVYDRCGSTCEEGIVDWPTAKKEGLASGSLPFGQVPSVTYHGKHLVQSMAILRYICDMNERTPDVDVYYDIDAFVGAYNDLRSKYSKLVYDNTIHEAGSTKIDDYKKVASTWLGYMENFVGEESEWIGGSEEWSFADVLCFEIVDMNVRLDPFLVKKIPTLMRIARRVAALPGVAAYLSSPGRRPHQNGNSAHLDCPSHPIERPFDWSSSGSSSSSSEDL